HTCFSFVTSHLFLLFCEILRLPPCFTLFPYTTLFRSRRTRSSGAPSSARTRSASAGPARRCAAFRRGSPAALRHRRSAGRSRRGDRKSTRLNSSHEWISYAVFCLKKKTNELKPVHEIM